jgi:hypothetical protein
MSGCESVRSGEQVPAQNHLAETVCGMCWVRISHEVTITFTRVFLVFLSPLEQLLEHKVQLRDATAFFRIFSQFNDQCQLESESASGNKSNVKETYKYPTILILNYNGFCTFMTYF